MAVAVLADDADGAPSVERFITAFAAPPGTITSRS
jgi:hypothetical protein